MTKKIIRRKVADKTRDNIIKAARKLFADKGYSGTTTLAIAITAKVNETLLFHHFGSKAKLWQTVKASVVAAVEPINQQPPSLRAFLQDIFTQRINAYKANPDLIRILQWQQMEKKQDRLAAGNAFAPSNWVAPIMHLQKTGKIDNTIDPEFIIVWLTATINTIAFDHAGRFDQDKKRKIYIDTLINRFERALVD